MDNHHLHTSPRHCAPTTHVPKRTMPFVVTNNSTPPTLQHIMEKRPPPQKQHTSRHNGVFILCKSCCAHHTGMLKIVQFIPCQCIPYTCRVICRCSDCSQGWLVEHACPCSALVPHECADPITALPIEYHGLAIFAGARNEETIRSNSTVGDVDVAECTPSHEQQQATLNEYVLALLQHVHYTTLVT